MLSGAGPCRIPQRGFVVSYTWNGGPVSEREYGRSHRLWWIGNNEGITLVRSDAGVWSEVTYPVDSTLTAASAVLRGGYTATVSDAYAAELTSAGYGAYLTAI